MDRWLEGWVSGWTGGSRLVGRTSDGQMAGRKAS